jgi:hypothetical protein
MPKANEQPVTKEESIVRPLVSHLILKMSFLIKVDKGNLDWNCTS